MTNHSETATFALAISKFALHDRLVTRSASKSGLSSRSASELDSAGTPPSSPVSEPPVNTEGTAEVSVNTLLKRSRSGRSSGREALLRGSPKRKKRGVNPPDPTLEPVPDILADELDILFCGINPGVTSSRKGHHFSHPSNRFWPSLYAGEITEMRLRPEDDATLPFLPIRMGLTNLCVRPSQGEGDLHTEEHGVGADILIRKLQDRRPRIVCFVGMGIWKAFFQYLVAYDFVPRGEIGNRRKGTSYSPADALMPYKLVHPQQNHGDAPDATLDGDHAPVKREDSPAIAHSLPTVKLEIDDEQPIRSLDENKIAPVTETLFFVMPNTSGLVAGYKPADYANFIATLKQRVLECRAGILNTLTFTKISPSQR